MGLSRWRAVGDRWPTRLALVASFIPPGSSVLDLGAGARALRDHLPEGCEYTPADLPEFDMNAGLWPEGAFDVAVMAGVLEYADRPDEALLRLRELAPLAIVTYAHDWRRPDPDWNNLDAAGFVSAALRAGYLVRAAAVWHHERVRPQVVWLLS